MGGGDRGKSQTNKSCSFLILPNAPGYLLFHPAKEVLGWHL